MVSPPDRIATALQQIECLSCVRSAEFACLAFEIVAQHDHFAAVLAGDGRRRFERALGRGDHDRFDIRQPWIAGLGCLLDFAGSARLQVSEDRGRRIEAVLGKDGERIGKSRFVGNGWTGADHSGIVVGHVGDQPRQHLRRLRGDGEPSALDHREVLSHRIHLDDVGARLQERTIDLLFVFQGEARRGQGQQRRRPAGNETKHAIVGTEPLYALKDAAGRLASLGIGHGVRGFDDLDALAGLAIAVAGDHKAFERMGPLIFDRLGHGGACLAGADDNGLSFRRLQFGDEGGQAGFGARDVQGGVEHGAQQGAGVGIFHLRDLRTIGARCNNCWGPAIRRPFPS